MFKNLKVKQAMYLEESSGDNGTHCNEAYSVTQKNTLLIVMGCIGIVSFSSCVVAVSLVFCLRLHKLFTYRLAMYQVLSAMMFSVICILCFALINYNANSLPDVVVCKAQAFLTEYVLWVKMMFTMNLMFHLLCLAVFLKNFENLELFYILFSTLFPLLFSWIPFIHNNYGGTGAWCWIRNWKDDCATQHYHEGIIELFTLWYGPLFVCLTIGIVAVIIIFSVLLWRMYKIKLVDQPLLEKNMKQKHKEALKELLPLLAYPFIFVCVYLFPLVNQLYDAVTPTTSFKLVLAHVTTISTMGLFSSAVLIFHIMFVKVKQQSNRNEVTSSTRESILVGTSKGITTNYSTVFLLPPESEVDEGSV